MAPFALSAKRARYSAIIHECRGNQHASHWQGFAFGVGFREQQLDSLGWMMKSAAKENSTTTTSDSLDQRSRHDPARRSP